LKKVRGGLEGAAEGRELWKEGLLPLCKEKASASTLIQADQFSWAERELFLVCKAGVYRQKCLQIYFKEP